MKNSFSAVSDGKKHNLTLRFGEICPEGMTRTGMLFVHEACL